MVPSWNFTVRLAPFAAASGAAARADASENAVVIALTAGSDKPSAAQSPLNSRLPSNHLSISSTEIVLSCAVYRICVSQLLYSHAVSRKPGPQIDLARPVAFQKGAEGHPSCIPRSTWRGGGVRHCTRSLQRINLDSRTPIDSWATSKRFLMSVDERPRRRSGNRIVVSRIRHGGPIGSIVTLRLPWYDKVASPSRPCATGDLWPRNWALEN